MRLIKLKDAQMAKTHKNPRQNHPQIKLKERKKQSKTESLFVELIGIWIIQNMAKKIQKKNIVLKNQIKKSHNFVINEKKDYKFEKQ